MRRKLWLGLFNLILCLSLIGTFSSAKANALPAVPNQVDAVKIKALDNNVSLADFTCTSLQSQAGTANTGEKPQSKVWYYQGKWWSVFPASSGVPSSGTWLWRLDGTVWTPMRSLSTSISVKADVKSAGSPAGSVVHILLYSGSSTNLASLEYSSGTYIAWSSRPGLSSIPLPGSETATIDIDSTSRMWVATENDTTDQIVVYYSATPYSTWNGPVSLAIGVNDDDISVITTLRNNTIGVLWSNQNTKRFGFRYHKDADPVDTWAADEVPASQSAHDEIGAGMADDHLHVAVGSDGTLYAAVKTSYDTSGWPKIAMLVRRLSGSSGAGVWDDLYGVSNTGTRGIVVLDEAAGVVSVIYTSAEGNNSNVFKQSAVEPIVFGAVQTMRSEANNDVSSTKQNINGELVAIYSNGTTINGSLCNFASTLPPTHPTLPVPTDGADGIPPNSDDNNAVNLQATVNDADSSNLTVSFYGRPACEKPSFTLAVLPDTQCYSAQINGGLLKMFDDQTQWIADHKTTRTIVYTTHLGDIVDGYTDLAQWDRANEALTRLETGSVAYGLSLGNHDGTPDSTTNFNTYFGVARFNGRAYYGGHYSSDNDNNYGLFSAEGMDFIVIHIEYGADDYTRAWANDLLSVQYPSRRAIVVTHNLLSGSTSPAPFSTEGQALYDALKANPNLFLILGGHLDTEVSRTDTYNGHTVYSLRSDYQTRTGGNGWMRLMEFQPTANQIQVYTYSPYLDQSETDPNSEFTLSYAMGGSGCEPFQLIETVQDVSPGTSPGVIWYDRGAFSPYEWYVTVSDGSFTTTGPTWSFTTGDPTAVNLVDFTVTSLPQGIQLGWQTAQETDLVGFNLYRAESPDGLQMKVNLQLIPAINPGQLRGNNYLYLDATPVAGKTYYYWVEWVGKGILESYGPTHASLAPYSTWLPIGLK